MSSTPWLFTNSLDSTAATAQFLKAHREKIAFEADERAQQRRAQLTEQSSSLHTPEARIRIWEKVHGLRLPSDPAHAILDVVAADTGLTILEVRQEQDARRERTSAIASQKTAQSA